MRIQTGGQRERELEIEERAMAFERLSQLRRAVFSWDADTSSEMRESRFEVAP
jgi:hypothetical protein